MQQAWQQKSSWCSKNSSTEMDGDIEADDRTQLSNLTAANEVIIYAGSPVDMN